jgi:membrane protein DedA with SNARE-associated domain
MAFLSTTGYAGLAFLVLVENVFPPIPSELIVPLAGYMARAGKLSIVGAIAAGTAGSVVGAMVLYYFGRKLGYERTLEFARRRGRWLTVCEPDVKRAKEWFDRHGAAAVFLCRLLPGIRSVISVPAGIANMPVWKFIAFTTAGSAVWISLLAALGFILSANFRRVEQYLDPISWVLLGAIFILYVVRVLRRK